VRHHRRAALPTLLSGRALTYVFHHVVLLYFSRLCHSERTYLLRGQPAKTNCCAGSGLSIGQQALDSIALEDWSVMFGNQIKLGIGLVSIVYDLILMVRKSNDTRTNARGPNWQRPTHAGACMRTCRIQIDMRLTSLMWSVQFQHYVLYPEASPPALPQLRLGEKEALPEEEAELRIALVADDGHH